MKKKILSKIIGSISDFNVNSLKRARTEGVDIVELRLDEFKNLSLKKALDISRRIKAAGFLLIVTIRSVKEGGINYIPDQKRSELFKAVLEFADGIDIEIGSYSIKKSIIEFAHKKNKFVIVSYHNFNLTPPKKFLNSIINKAIKDKPDFIKLSVKSNTLKDVLLLAEITLQNCKKNIITVSMGQYGRISRLLFPIFGSKFTYAFLDKSHAPGQIKASILKNMFEVFG